MNLPVVALFAWASVVQQSHADLPVHCLRHQVAGDWEFTLGPLGSKRSSCGHQKPDIPLRQPTMKFLELQGELTKKKFSLKDPSTVSSEDGTGSWTMIYDEGFEVAMNDLVYFAFSKFSFTSGPEGQNNISHCGETQIGWYHNTARNRWGCYVGKKLNPSPGDTVMPSKAPAKVALVQVAEKDDEDSSEDLAMEAFGSSSEEVGPVNQDAIAKSPDQPVMSLEQDVPPAVAAPDPSASTYAQDEALDDPFKEPAEYKPWVPNSAGFDKPMKGNFQDGVASALNFLQLGWTASAYDQFAGKTPRQLNRLAGTKHNRIHAERKDELKTSFTSFLGVSSKHKRIRRVSVEEGDNFDWRNKDGKNFLEDVVTQGDCGSCYTISTVHMLTARNKIRAGKTSEPSFSVSFPLYCSEYNQGCDGGYGFLQSKWNEDVGLVPASCAPFSTGGGSCKVTANCDLGGKRYRAHNHHYVGGYYGGSDAESIRQELVKNGPLVMSFEPKEDFMYYNKGVYKSAPQKIHQEWEQVDHAVLLMAYGVDAKQAYWTLQNSWGTDWGEAGYFRMARGSDESGCESIAVAAEVIEETSNPILESFISEL